MRAIPGPAIFILVFSLAAALGTIAAIAFAPEWFIIFIDHGSSKLFLFFAAEILFVNAGISIARIFWLPSCSKLILSLIVLVAGILAITVGTPIVLYKLNIVTPYGTMLAQFAQPGATSFITSVACIIVIYKFVVLYADLERAQQGR